MVRRAPLSIYRPVAAWTLAVLGPCALTAVFHLIGHSVNVGSALLILLCVALGVTTLGGRGPGLLASVTSVLLTMYFVAVPTGFSVHRVEDLVALVVFALVTLVTGFLVEKAAHQAQLALVARKQAKALGRSAAALVGHPNPLAALLEELRSAFDLEATALVERTDHGWRCIDACGATVVTTPDDGTSIDLADDGSVKLIISGNTVEPDQLAVLRAFGDQIAVARQAEQLRAEAARAAVIAEGDELRAALLRAVSHDLRTPLATIKASASGLLQTEVQFSASDQRELLVDIDQSADRLTRMVRDLLDMSRLQAGVMPLRLGPTALEEVVATALASLPTAHDRVEADISESLPLVMLDQGLFERAVANITSNAISWSPPSSMVSLAAHQMGDVVVLRIADHGPGVPREQHERIFVPFQRLGDRSNEAGAGLGLAIAKGFADAMAIDLRLEETVGGGLTMVMELPIAHEHSPNLSGRHEVSV